MKKFLFLLPLVFLACTKSPHKSILKCEVNGTKSPLWVCYQSFNQFNAKEFTKKPSLLIEQELLAKGSSILSKLISDGLNSKDKNLSENIRRFVSLNSLPVKTFYDKNNQIYNVLIQFEKDDFLKFLKEMNVSERVYFEKF